VEAGELSVHGALVEAGLRERTVTVLVSRPEKAADVLCRSLDPEQLERLVELLTQNVQTSKDAITPGT